MIEWMPHEWKLSLRKRACSMDRQNGYCLWSRSYFQGKQVATMNRAKGMVSSAFNASYFHFSRRVWRWRILLEFPYPSNAYKKEEKSLTFQKGSLCEKKTGNVLVSDWDIHERRNWSWRQCQNWSHFKSLKRIPLAGKTTKIDGRLGRKVHV